MGSHRFAAVLALLAVFLAAATAAPAAANSLARPSGPVVLTVTGAIAGTNAPGKAEFDMAMLEALGVDEIATTTEWTGGKAVFSGVRVSKVLDAVGASGTMVLARALNDYSGEVPAAVFADYPALLAWRVNGEDLPADKAPLWIVYPTDDFPALGERGDLLWAWALASLDVR